ncbi:MAG: hypothetical protein JSV08_08175, partial [Acidobacteriota bacterium]
MKKATIFTILLGILALAAWSDDPLAWNRADPSEPPASVTPFDSSEREVSTPVPAPAEEPPAEEPPAEEPPAEEPPAEEPPAEEPPAE